MPPHKKGHVNEVQAIAKSTGLRKFVRSCVGSNLYRYRKVNKVGNLMIGEPAADSSVNSSRNYNDSKAVKFPEREKRF